MRHAKLTERAVMRQDPKVQHNFTKVGAYVGLGVFVCHNCGLAAVRGQTIPAECSGAWD
jgi:hypothetical protein